MELAQEKSKNAEENSKRVTLNDGSRDISFYYSF